MCDRCVETAAVFRLGGQSEDTHQWSKEKMTICSAVYKGQACAYCKLRQPAHVLLGLVIANAGIKAPRVPCVLLSALECRWAGQVPCTWMHSSCIHHCISYR